MMKIPPRKRKTAFSSLRRITGRFGLPLNVRRQERAQFDELKSHDPHAEPSCTGHSLVS